MNENTNITGKDAEDKKRGGQPGNQNARTHGFYSRAFSLEQQEALESASDLKDLNQEIALMRLKILSIITNDPDNHAVLMKAVSVLARLLNINRDYNAKCEDLRSQLALSLAQYTRIIKDNTRSDSRFG